MSGTPQGAQPWPWSCLGPAGKGQLSFHLHPVPGLVTKDTSAINPSRGWGWRLQIWAPRLGYALQRASSQQDGCWGTVRMGGSRPVGSG